MFSSIVLDFESFAFVREDPSSLFITSRACTVSRIFSLHFVGRWNINRIRIRLTFQNSFVSKVDLIIKIEPTLRFSSDLKVFNDTMRVFTAHYFAPYHDPFCQPFINICWLSAQAIVSDTPFTMSAEFLFVFFFIREWPFSMINQNWQSEKRKGKNCIRVENVSVALHLEWFRLILTFSWFILM